MILLKSLRFTLLFIAILSGSLAAQAQVNTYSFSQSNVPYVGLTSPTILTPLVTSPTNYTTRYHVQLPFTFTLDTLTSDSLWIHINGFVALKSTTPFPTDQGEGALAGDLQYQGVIAAFNRGLNAGNPSSPHGAVKTATTGTAPNRIFTIEWRNMYAGNWPGGSAYHTFQIKLHETGNEIQFAYGTQNVPANTAYNSAQVGLRGATADFAAGEVTNRKTNNSWNNTTAGTSSSASCTIDGSPMVKPDSGLLFTWTPPAPCNAVNVTAALPDSMYLCMNTNTTLTPTGVPVVSGLGYQWQQSTDNSNWADVTGSGTNYSFYTTPNITSPVYYRLKITCSPTATAFYTNSCKLQNPAGLPTPYFEGFESITANNTLPQCMTSVNGWLGKFNAAPNNLNARSGTKYGYANNSNAHNLLITQGIQLSAGTQYRISYWYQASTAYAATDTLRTLIGTFPHEDSLTLITPGAVIVNPHNNTNYRRADYYFTVPVAGIYYMGIDLNEPYYYIDDISVMEVPGTDALVDTIVSPYLYEPICLNSQTPVTIRVKNGGQQPISNIPVYFNLNGTTYGPEMVTATINPGVTANYTFSQTANMSGIYTDYDLKAWTALSTDNYVGNDTIWSTLIKTDTLYTVPYIMGWEGITNMYPSKWKENDHGFSSTGQIYNPSWSRNISSNIVGYELEYNTSFLTKLKAPPLGPIANNTFIQFDYRVTNYAGTQAKTLSPNDTIFLVVSSDCGASYDTIYALHAGNQASTHQFTTIGPLYVGNYAGQNLKVAVWIKHSGTLATGTMYFDMDNYTVSNLPLQELAVNAVLQPGGYGCVGSTLPVRVAIQNNAGLTATGFQLVADLSTQTAVLNYTYPGSLAYGKKDTVTLGNVTVAHAGAQQMKVYAIIAGDVDNLNDTATRNIFVPATPVAPLVAGDTVCSGTAAQLGANLPDSLTYFWYNSNTAITPLHKGATYTTVALSTPATFFAEMVTVQPGRGGKEAFTGSGSFLSNGYGLVLDAETDLMIDSVAMYPSGSGNITVTVQSCVSCTAPIILGTYTYTFTNATGQRQMLPMGVFLPQGQGYFMKISSFGSNIYALGRDFPFSGYPLHNSSALTVAKGYGNNTDQYDSYYYFYDMAVRSFGCNSARVAVPVDVAPQPQPFFSINQQGGQITINNGSNGGGTYSWDFGDGNTSSAVSPTHTYSQSGTYEVKLTQTNDCGTAVTTRTITVILTGVDEIAGSERGVQVYPNPANDHVVIKSTSDAKQVSYTVTTATGVTISKGMLQGKKTRVSLAGFVPGMYIILVNGERRQSFRIMKQ